MPIYAFRCSACGHDFDRLQKLSDPDPAACPACAEACVQRQLTAPSFRLAGSGWYETDFKKEGDKKRNLAGEGGDAAAPKPEAGAKDGAAKTVESGSSTPKAETGASTKPEAKPAATDSKAAAKPPAPVAAKPVAGGPDKTT